MLDLSKGVILDTHVWIWLNQGNPGLSKDVVAQIDRARRGGVFIPSIVLWEVCTLAAKGRISLGLPTLQWLKEGLRQPGVELTHIEPEIAVESVQLAGGFHGDPADRLIVATARVMDLPVITRDAKILDYSVNGGVKAIKA